LRSTGNDTTSEWALNTVRGNLAAAPQPARKVRETPAAIVAPQRTLFPDRPASNVIPFDVLTGGNRAGVRLEPPAMKAPDTPQAAPAPKTRTPGRTPGKTGIPGKTGMQPKRLSASQTVDQPELDFLPASVAPRTLKTSVRAVIFCDAPVATLPHRSLACAVDFSLILIGYFLCLASYFCMGGGLPGGRLGYIVFAVAFAFLSMFYGLLWTLAMTETPGMRWASLRLTNFDGFAPDPSQRVLRYLSSVLSFACGFGLLWALVDEESLTWQDHISKTFPTFHRPE